MELIFATGNLNKLIEASDILGASFKLQSLRQLGFTGEIEEPWHTFEENALAKARFVYQKYGMNCFSDDSGLEVEALGGLPGVQSAYYAGPEKNCANNLSKLLRELEHQPIRVARFRTVVALILRGKEHIFEGTVNGAITYAPQGDGGFGYDPVFVPNGYTATFGELPKDVKNLLSHRAEALRKMRDFLLSLEQINP